MRAPFLMLWLLAGCRDYDALGHEPSADASAPDAAVVSMTDGGHADGSTPADLGCVPPVQPGVPAHAMFAPQMLLTASPNMTGAPRQVIAMKAQKGAASFVAFDSSRSEVAVYKNDTAGTPPAFTQTEEFFTSSSAPEKVLALDVDGDGQSEIVALYTNGIVQIIPLSNNVSIAQILLGSDSAADAVTADFDDDGQTELFVFTTGGQGYVFRWDGSSSTPTQVGSPISLPRPSTVAVLDADGDCFPDIAWVSAMDGAGEILYGSKGGVTSPMPYTPIDAATQIAPLVDASGEQGLYVLAGGVVYRELGGLPGTPISLGTDTTFTVTAVSPGDLDGDGATDFIAWDDKGYGTTVVWMAGAAQVHAIDNVVVPPGVTTAPLLIDLDLDGVLDILIGDPVDAMPPYWARGS